MEFHLIAWSFSIRLVSCGSVEQAIETIYEVELWYRVTAHKAKKKTKKQTTQNLTSCQAECKAARPVYSERLSILVKVCELFSVATQNVKEQRKKIP